MSESANGHNEHLTILQVLLPLVVSSSKGEVGLGIGWTAVLHKAQMENSTSLAITPHDVKWIVSMTGIAGMLAISFTGPLIEFMGPRRLLLWTYLPCAALWFVVAFTPYVSLLYFGRLGLNLIFIILDVLIPSLTSDLSDPRIRGFTLAVEEILVAAGILVMYILAQWLDWETSAAICAAPSVLLFVFCLFLPESPYWLARNGRMDEAKATLFKLRSSKTSASEEITHLTNTAKERLQTTFLDQLKQLRIGQNIRPVLLVLSIFVLREIGGEYIIFNYTVYIFQQAQVEMDAFTCTVLVGVVRVIFTVISSFLLDRLGRRPLIIATTVVCLLSAFICGVFMIIDVPETPSWISLAAVLVYVASYGLGLGPIPWGLMGEMIPTPVRSVGGPICIFGYSLAVFAISYAFPVLVTSLGLGLVFILFSASLFILAIVLCLWLPETKGKTLSDLQDAFKRKPKSKNEAPSTASSTSNGVHCDKYTGLDNVM